MKDLKYLGGKHELTNCTLKGHRIFEIETLENII